MSMMRERARRLAAVMAEVSGTGVRTRSTTGTASVPCMLPTLTCRGIVSIIAVLQHSS